MSAGRGHDRSKRADRGAVRGVESRDPEGRSGRTLQEAAGNQAVAAVVQGAAPLVGAFRTPLEREYEVDLGGVRLHTGDEAARQTSAQGTVAFTRGDDVYLDDAAARDPLVIGHELVHAIQQTRPGAGTAEADLEAEAASVSEGASGDIGGGAAFGSVQRFWPFADDQEDGKAQEKKRRDEEGETAVKQLNVLASTEEWKKYVDDPLIGGWLRAHPGRFDPRGENREFQRWLADPKYRPSGAAAAQPSKPVELPEAKDVPWIKRAGESVEHRRAEKAAFQRWSPQEKAMWARSQIEDTRRRHFESMIPAKGSFAELLWTVGEEIGAHSWARAWTGENEWAQPLDPGERFSEAVLGSAKFTSTVLTVATALPERGPLPAGTGGPMFADELLAGGSRETLSMLPSEAQAVEQGSQTLGRGGEVIDDLAKSAEGKFVKGQDVVLPQQHLATPKTGGPGGGVVAGGAPEVEAGGLRVQPKVGPQVVPEPITPPPAAKPQQPLTMTPELAAEKSAAESGWAEAEAQAAKERFAPKKHVPTPVSPATGVETAKDLGRSAAGSSPLIDKQERKFPAAEERPPMKDEEKPPLMIDPERREEKAQFPSAQKPVEGEKKAPSEKAQEEKGPMIAAPRKVTDKEMDEAFKEEKGKVDVRKTPPTAEESQPQTREPELAGKKRKQLLAQYEQAATKKIPQIVREVLKNQELTDTRKTLAKLKYRFEKLMRKVGDAPKLTPAQRTEAMEVLETARPLARDDFGNVQKAVWNRLRQDPDLLEIEKKLRKTGDVGPGERALQIPTKRIDDSDVEFDSLGLEHRVRLSDDPWLYNHPENLLVTDAAQNEQYLEAIRRYGIWPTTETEEFVTRHGLSSQPYDFAPGSRPTPDKKP